MTTECDQFVPLSYFCKVYGVTLMFKRAKIIAIILFSIAVWPDVVEIIFVNDTQNWSAKGNIIKVDGRAISMILRTLRVYDQEMLVPISHELMPVKLKLPSSLIIFFFFAFIKFRV